MWSLKTAEQDMIMKENQSETLHGSKSFGREVDPLAFESKEVYEINGLKRDTCPSPFEPIGKDESWNAKFVDDLSIESEKDEYLNVKDKVQSTLEHEHTVAGEEFVHRDETESKDSRSQFITSSNPFENDNLFNDKIVCYKEVNYHVVKDICIDDGMPLRDFLTYSSKDDQSDHSSLNGDSHGKATEAVHISDELADTLLENTKDNTGNEHGSEEECHNILLSQERPESPDKDAAKDCDHKDLLQSGETNSTASGKTVTHTSSESSVDNSLPIQEFGTRSFLRSFLDSLDDGALSAQISSGKVVSEGRTPSAETAQKEDIQATDLHYNSKVETGSITFNFNSPNVGPENIKEQSVDSKDSLSYKGTTSDNAHDHQTLDIKDENPVLLSKGEVGNSPEHRDPDNDAVVSFRKYDESESSFSASGFINYSGPIAYSGALSDGSATSGRSFAFPVLQNEWNSSPVRMAKGDGRHFRKHRGWRSGLFCCRF